MSENILILGAGMSGLMAANTLNQAGHSVTILEKSRGVGGRMATRRFKDGKFDHGAQFFTVRDPQFKPLVDQWVVEGIAREWTRDIPISGESSGKNGHPRYIGVNGMTGIAKHLSRDLDIHLNTRAETISTDGELWVVKTKEARAFTGKHLILTAPVPQSLKLLEGGKIPLPKDGFKKLRSIHYHPCIAVLVLLEGSSAVPAPGGIKFDSGPIQWVADNTQKGISPHKTAVTIHASAGFSQDHYDLNKEQLAEMLLEAAKPWLATTILDWQLHKWRYSQPNYLAKERFIRFDLLPNLYFAGDAFGGARVEGAALSGMAAGNGLHKRCPDSKL